MTAHKVAWIALVVATLAFGLLTVTDSKLIGIILVVAIFLGAGAVLMQFLKFIGRHDD